MWEIRGGLQGERPASLILRLAAADGQTLNSGHCGQTIAASGGQLQLQEDRAARPPAVRPSRWFAMIRWAALAFTAYRASGYCSLPALRIAGLES